MIRSLLLGVAIRVVLLAACIDLTGCGATSEKAGGETHWLQKCASDSECAVGICSCHVCTATCEQTAECAAFGAQAVCAKHGAPQFSEICGPATTPSGICAARMAVDDAAAADSSLATDAGFDTGRSDAPLDISSGPDGPNLIDASQDAEASATDASSEVSTSSDAACNGEPASCNCGASGSCGSGTSADPLRCCNPAEDSCTSPSRCGYNPCVPEQCSPASGTCGRVLGGAGRVADRTPCDDGNSCSSVMSGGPVFHRCDTACESDGTPGCATGQSCVLMTGAPGTTASGYCCPTGTACTTPGGLCFGNSGRGNRAGAFDECRAGVCSYDIGPATLGKDDAGVDAGPAEGSAPSDVAVIPLDGPLTCPARVPPGTGEATLCGPFLCKDPEQNGDYNPCAMSSDCDLLGTLLCLEGDPVPDGTPCDDSFVRLFPGPRNDLCRGACTSASPPPSPPAACSCSSDCPPRHECLHGTCVCNDGHGTNCNDVCRAGFCVSDVNKCGAAGDL